MRVGLQLGYDDPAFWVGLAEEAERCGFHSVWTSEAYGSDAVSPLAWVGSRTTTVRLGTAIMQMPARSPATTAATVATLDLLSGGRVLLGLGTSGPQVAEGWHGQRFGRQLRSHLSRAYIRKDRISGGRCEVVGDPVRESMRFVAERLGIHIAKARSCHGTIVPPSRYALWWASGHYRVRGVRQAAAEAQALSDMRLRRAIVRLRGSRERTASRSRRIRPGALRVCDRLP